MQKNGARMIPAPAPALAPEAHEALRTLARWMGAQAADCYWDEMRAREGLDAAHGETDA